MKNVLFKNSPVYVPKIVHSITDDFRVQQAQDQVLNIGIIGGGMSGLYAAALLKNHGHNILIFESDNRTGGRVYTHRFNDEPYQYFEAGAMRFPNVSAQKKVFDVIEELNQCIAVRDKIDVIDFPLEDADSNFVFVNRAVNQNGSLITVNQANSNPSLLKFRLEPDLENKTAIELLDTVIGKWRDALRVDFEKAFKELFAYDDYLFRSYLTLVAKWDETTINYCETMTSTTGQYENAFVEICIEYMDFTTAAWKTIDNGMDHLPNALADVIGREYISLTTRVIEIENLENGSVKVYYQNEQNTVIKSATFDAVLAAVPSASLRLIQKPEWSILKEDAIRSSHFEPLYKIGLRFKKRFWEMDTDRFRASFGGQSVTDLPSRWFVYPPFDLHGEGPGTMQLYAWMSDAAIMATVDPTERERIALRDLQTVYININISELFIESYQAMWAEKWPAGDAMFYPGQFKNYFNSLRTPEGNVFFAGEHLSEHHTWIVGAMESAEIAVGQIIGQQVGEFRCPDTNDEYRVVGQASSCHP